MEPLTDTELDQLRALDGPEPHEIVSISRSVQHLAIRAVVELEDARADVAVIRESRDAAVGHNARLIAERDSAQAEVARYRKLDDELGTHAEIQYNATSYCAETDAVHDALVAAGKCDGDDWVSSDTRTLATEVASLAAERDRLRRWEPVVEAACAWRAHDGARECEGEGEGGPDTRPAWVAGRLLDALADAVDEARKP